MSERVTNTPSIAAQVALWVLVVVFIGLLAPFAFIGETWGMIWMLAAAPVSFILEASVGISRRTPLLIGFVSLAAAMVWAGVAFLIVRMFTRR